MKNGDLSNHAAPTIAFRVEDFLVKYKKEKITDKVLNFIFSKEQRAEINEDAMSLMNFLFRHTDMTVDLVVENKNNNSNFLKLVESLPYNRVIQIIKPVEIAVLLTIGEIDYYVDDDPERRSLVGHRYAVSLEEMNKLINRRGQGGTKKVEKEI